MPPFDTQKHPFDQSLSRFTRNEIEGMQWLLAKSVPCSVEEVDKTGTIVTVKLEVQQEQFTFPKLQMPVYGPQYIRWPIQKGDKGVMLSADYSIAAMSGLGKGVAKMSTTGNLSNGVFFPIGNTKFSEREEGEDKKVVLYGPDGVVIRTEKGDKGKVDVSDKGVTIYTTTGDDKGNYLKMTEVGFEFYVNGSLKCIIDGAGMRMIGGPRVGGGNFGVTITDHGTQIDNFNWLGHIHQGVQPGSGNSQKINEAVSPP